MMMRTISIALAISRPGQPVFELAAVVIRHDGVTNTIHATFPQVSTVKVEVGKMPASKVLDEVLLDTASNGNEARDALVLHKCCSAFEHERQVRVGELVQFTGGSWFIREAPTAPRRLGAGVAKLSVEESRALTILTTLLVALLRLFA